MSSHDVLALTAPCPVLFHDYDRVCVHSQVFYWVYGISGVQFMTPFDLYHIYGFGKKKNSVRWYAVCFLCCPHILYIKGTREQTWAKSL